jgi:hypothetical protein
MKKFSIELKWGLIFVLVMLAWMYMEKLLGWHDQKIDKHTYLTMIFILPAVLIYIIALRDKRNNYYGGKMNWFQGLMSGILIGFIVALLSPLSQFIILRFITPEYLDNAIRYAVDNGIRTQVQAENEFTLRNYIIQAIIGALALGTITGAIVSIFIRKK